MTEPRHQQYAAFVASEAAKQDDDGYLFDSPRCRFSPEPADELVAMPGLAAVATAAGVAVVAPGGVQLAIQGFDVRTLQRVLTLLPCRYARVALELGPRSSSFIEQTFSRVLFAPSAVAELELAQPACEIVRFPGSPYEVVRSYWRNLGSVRRRLDALLIEGPPVDVPAFRELLLELHRLLLLGDTDGAGPRSFYLPASALARKRVTPGEFYEGSSAVQRDGPDVVITSGARVSVPLLGGALYWQLLAESVSDEAALSDHRKLELDGIDWGQVVLGRAADELQNKPWFLPPRPLAAQHFETLLGELHAAWEASRRGDLQSALAALASFHFGFVRAHPLPSANQSLAMSFVNSLLRPLLGIGMPHLLLDQLALRFDRAPYGRIFARAARAWSAPWPSATERLRSLLRMRGELNAFVMKLGTSQGDTRLGTSQGGTSLIEARALIEEEPHGAKLALLTEPGDVSLGIG
jgi:hypothetical protein